MSDNTAAGATPADPGATPQTDDGANADAQGATPPADGLGDAGRKALESERKAARDALKRAEAAEKELEKLRSASQSDHDKAIDAARKEGAADAAKVAGARIRKAEVRSALTAAGIQATELDLAAFAPELADLEVDDEGEVKGLAEAVTAFKAAHPSLFGKPAQAGTADGGVRGQSASRIYTRQEIKDPAFYAKNREDILAATAEGRIRG